MPARTRGREILDDPATPDEVRARAMRDVARSNRLFGGTRAVVGQLLAIGNELPRNSVLVDVGTGTGDIPAAARSTLRRYGIDVHAIGVDASELLLRSAGTRIQSALAGDARQLPLRDKSADVVTCSQVLHHFFDDDIGLLLSELDRISRGWVIVSDLQRSWLAAGGFWLASSAFRFHEVTRLDGMTSVLRGFQPDELTEHVRMATGVTPIVRTGVFWRLTARWRPRPATRTAH